MKKGPLQPDLPPVFDPKRTLRLAGALIPLALTATFLLVGGPAGCRRPKQSVAFNTELAVAERVRTMAEEVRNKREMIKPVEDVDGALASTRVFEAAPEAPPPPTPKPPPPPEAPTTTAGKPAPAVASADEPAAPPVPVAPAARFVLKGIIWNDAQPLALINDQTLGVGEAVGGRKVVRIERTRVILGGTIEGAAELVLDEDGSPDAEVPAGKP